MALRFRSFVLLTVALLWLTSTANAAVWMTDGMVKVQPSDGPSSANVNLAGARNEFVDFQVHVRAGASPIRLNVSAGDFVDPVSHAHIRAATNVFIYREAYLNITTLSDLNGRLGVTPDPLVPVIDPYVHEARRAFPVTVPANRTQSIWIGVLIPPAAPAGVYRGTVTVKNGATVLATLAPTIRVWNFALPATSSLASAFGMAWNGMCVAAYGSYFNCAQYPGSGGSNDRGVELTHVAEATMMLDHRVTVSGTVYYGPPIGDWAHFDGLYGPLLSGRAGTLLRGASQTSTQFFYQGDSTTAAQIRNWVNHFSARGWLPKLFDYSCDEPPAGCTWAEARARTAKIHNGSPLLATLVTTDIAKATAQGLFDLVDLLTPVLDAIEPKNRPNQRGRYDAFLAKPHKRLWWYQSCDQHESCSNGFVGGAGSTWPSYMIDATPVRNRVFQWFAFLDRIGGELYYEIDYCWVSDRCASPDPWTSVYAFGGNGDGTLIYPGTTDRIGGTTPIALPSIRLKLIRDGMQDYEYLKLLTDAGQGAFARSVARSFITNATTFNNDPAALTTARARLGAKLHQISLKKR
jgi:Domain of unknown function (DUF4091)